MRHNTMRDANPILFWDAEWAWLPKLIDIEGLKQGNDKDYYSKFGWEQLEVPEDCPNVQERMENLKVIFDEKYAYRMVNCETLEQWQTKLQAKFDSIVRRYERGYELYSLHSQEMKDDVLEGSRTTTTSNAQAGGSDTVHSKTSDTPDQSFNDSSIYAGSTNDGKTTYGRTDKVTATTEFVVTGTGLVQSVNATIDDWRDIDVSFINEFENNFLNILWC